MTESAQIASRLSHIVSNSNLNDTHLDDAVVQALVELFGATKGRIYALNLSSGHYVSRDPRPPHGVASFNARRLRDHDRWGPLEYAVSKRAPQVRHSPSTWDTPQGRNHYASRLVIPILRQNTVVALVDLHGSSPGDFRPWRGERLKDAAEAFVPQLASIYEARAVHRILEQTAEFKVDLYKDEATALRNLMNFVGVSSGMQYAVLRRIDGVDALRCVCTYGFPQFADQTLSFMNFSKDYLPFAEVVKTRNHWRAPNLRGDAYRALRDQPELTDVYSFVACPVLLGNSIWGVLSFAAAVEYEYSDLEIYSLRALANLAGVALDAAQLADRAAEGQFDDGRLMQAVLSNEVVVATRHSMSDQLEIVGGARSSLLDIIDPLTDPDHGTRLTRRDIDDLVFLARSLDTAHEEMNRIFETIRVSQRELLPEAKRVVIADVWARATESFNFRINRAHLTRVVCDVPPNLAIVGSEDWLRIVFMHLLLNSLDAFERPFAKNRRDIALRLESIRDGEVRLRYYDTAGGIIPRSLVRRGVPVPDTSDVRKAIFERFVSSKTKGTGLGLASCRAALATMNGAIELVDWRRGVTFDITLTEWSE